jgi:DNA polymerase III psi subunit
MIDQQTAYTEDIYLLKDKRTVVLSEPWDKVTEADRQLLQKILQSVRLNTAAVRILHNSGPTNNAFIYFGANEVKTEGNAVHAPSLSQLQNDTAAKQKLWVALKQLFGL